LRLLRPGLKRVGVLVNPLELQLTGLDDAAAILGLQLQQFEIRTASALSGAFEAIDHARVEALLVPGDAQADEFVDNWFGCISGNVDRLVHRQRHDPGFC
jgi:hypothetical protein